MGSSQCHSALGYPSSPAVPLPAPTAATASLQPLGQVGCRAGAAGWRGGLTQQVWEATSHSDCWGQSLTCGLAIVKGHPTSYLGEGCVSLLIKGELPLRMGNRRQPQRVPLLNRKESDVLSRLGGELRAAVSQLALSHPREDKLSPHDPSQRPEPGQIRGWSHLREKSG